MSVPERTDWKAVWVLAAGAFLVGLDMTLVAIALPEMQDDLNASRAAIEWVLVGFALPMVAFALPGGRFIDRVTDREGLYVATMFGFGAASLLIGIAPTVELVIAGRVAQGLFGVTIVSLTSVLVMSVAAASSRARALSMLSVASSIGAISGPAIGGHLLAATSWPWIFFINVPLVIAIAAFVRGSVPKIEVETAPRSRAWLGEALLLFVAAGAVLYSLTAMAKGSYGEATIAMAVGVIGAVMWVRFTADRELVALLRSRRVMNGPAGIVTIATLAGALYFLLPFVLIDELGASSGEAGNTLLGYPVGILAGALVAGTLADRFGPAPVAFVGSLFALVGAALAAGVGPGWSLPAVAAVLVVSGCGQGLVIGPVMSHTLGRAPANAIGTVSAVMALARNLGFSLGPAFATIVWHTSGRLSDAFAIGLTAATLAVAAFGALLVFDRRERRV